MQSQGAGALALVCFGLLAQSGYAQGAPPPQYGGQQPGYGQAPPQPAPPPPANAPEGSGAPPPASAPPPAAAYPAPEQPPAQGYGQPAPAYGATPEQQYSPPPSAPPPPPREERIDEPPPPDPPEKGEGGFKMPPWSVRVDPFTWLIEGRLGFELEVGLLKWMTAELVPVFVTNDTPPTLSSFGGRDDAVKQESNGAGPISGTSIGLGFWLSGHALQGYVLRAIFTNYGYKYKTDGLTDSSGVQHPDHLVHTDRWLMGMFGSHSTWGPFTIAGGIGLGVDLNSAPQCYPEGPIAASDVGNRQGSGCKRLELVTQDRNRNSVVVDVSPPFYPVVIAGRISLGVTFD